VTPKKVIRRKNPVEIMRKSGSLTRGKCGVISVNG